MTDDEIRQILIRRKKRKVRAVRKLLAVLIFVIILLLILPSRTVTSFDRNLIKPYGNRDAEAPKIQAKGAAVYSLDLDSFVYEKNPDTKIDPYSITKILTCYLAIENLDPDETVTIKKSNADLNYIDGSHILLLKGEKISVNDLLHGTMMSSANDAAYALGMAVSGSEKEFAKLMNEQVKEWGCTNTYFINPNGWKNKMHYTTAHDMAIITAKCFENEKLREISMEKEYVIPATNKSEKRELENFFRKSTKGIEGIDCGKTGSWEDDDCSIALEFTEDHLNAVLVLLRDTVKKRPADIKRLMKYSHVVTPGFTVASEGDAVCDVAVKGGAETHIPLVMDKTVHVYPHDNKERNIKVDIDADKLEAPVVQGVKAGTYNIFVDGKEVESGELFTSENVEKGWILSGLYISNSMTIIGVIAISMFLLIMRVLSKSSKKRTLRDDSHRVAKH